MSCANEAMAHVEVQDGKPGALIAEMGCDGGPCSDACRTLERV